MSLRVILRILGLLLMLFSLTMLPPMLISLWFRDGVWHAFMSGIAISVITGLLLFLPNRRAHKELRIRDGFIIAAMFWTVLALFGSLPLMLFGEGSLGVTDAVFESFSRANHDRCNRHYWHRFSARIQHPLLSPAVAVVKRRHGDCSVSGGHFAHLGCRGNGPVPY